MNMKSSIHKAVGTLILFLISVGAQGNMDAEERVFLRAQCKARCLRYFNSASEDDVSKVS